MQDHIGLDNHCIESLIDKNIKSVNFIETRLIEYYSVSCLSNRKTSLNAILPNSMFPQC